MLLLQFQTKNSKKRILSNPRLSSRKQVLSKRIEILSGEDVGRKISVAWEQMPGTAIKTSTATSANPIGGNLRVLYLDPSVEYHHRPVTRPRRAKRICKWATCLRYPATITTSSPSLPPSSTTATIEFKLSNENTAALFDPR